MYSCSSSLLYGEWTSLQHWRFVWLIKNWKFEHQDSFQKQENSGSSDNSEDENGNALNISDDIESDPDYPEETFSEEEEDLLDSTDKKDMEGAGQGEGSNQDVL